MRIASKATKGKGKTWKKGQSSSSNPETTKFRSRTKFHTDVKQDDSVLIEPKTGLTLAAIETHNAFNLDNLKLGTEEDDEQSVVSFASAWSKCTNPSFDRFLNGWQSTSILHKEMLAVLGSVTETIKSKGGTESETEYFAVLTTMLETVDTSDGLTAVIQLLRMVLKRLPASILKLKFSDTANVLVKHLGNYTDSSNGSLLRGLLASLASLLRAQDEAIWTLSNTRQTFAVLLSFTTHPKPRVRKAAHRAVIGIVKGSALLTKPETTHHPCASTVATFCISKMEETSLKDDISKVLHAIALLKDVLPVLPQSSIKLSCETMLRFMTLGNVLVLTCCFQAFNALFLAKPQGLTAELNVQIILALQDFQPSVSDSQPLAAWLTVIREAMICLYGTNPPLYFKHVGSVIEINITCWLSDSKQVQDVVATTMNDVVKMCLDPVTEKHSRDSLVKTCAAIQSCLSYQYNTSWSSVISVVAETFTVLGAKRPDITLKTLKILGELRESDRFQYVSELDKAVANAVKANGPELVLKAIPLREDLEGANFAKSWLVMVLRDNVSATKLAFFSTYFMPLIVKVKSTIKSLTAANREVDGKAMRIYYDQLWSLLPSFCSKPTDVKDSLKLLAKGLGVVLSEDSEIRPYVLSALRNLIKTVEREEDRLEVAKYAKNYLPILLNVYTKEQDQSEKDKRLAVLGTIACYLEITDSALTESIFTRATEKYTSTDEAYTRLALLDVLRVFTPHLSKSQLQGVFNDFVVELIQKKKTAKEQKKGYRLLEDMCKSESKSCKSFVYENLGNLLSLLIKGLKTSPSAAKSAPINALNALVERYFVDAPEDSKKLIMKLLPTVIDCLLINTVRVRNASNQFVLTIATTLSKLEDGLNQLYNFVLLVMKQASTDSKSAVVNALTNLLPFLKETIPKPQLRIVCIEALNFLKSDNRTLIQSVFSFMKVLFREIPKDDLLSLSEVIVTHIDELSVQNRKHFRMPIRELFVRLSRKFGNEFVAKIVPESFSKVLRNVRKVEARKSKKKDDDDEEEENKPQRLHLEKNSIEDVLRDSSEDDMDDDDDDQPKTKASTWIEEKAGEEVLDLLSSKANRKLLSTNPYKKKVQKMKEDSFLTAADGRIIIGDTETEAVDKEVERTPAVKRQQDDDGQEDDEDAAPQEPAAKYQHGGKGIHRVTAKSYRKEKGKRAHQDLVKTGREYRSQKAAGDMKKKGLPDPYAYVPLERSSLNKRKKAKQAGQFKNILSAAKRGADKGARDRVKRKGK